MPDKSLRYTIFKTTLGYFGLGGSNCTLFRTYLHVQDRKKVERNLLKDLPAARYDRGYFRSLQDQIAAYFEGARVDFSPEIPVLTEGFSRFARLVLAACRQIRFGQMLTYSRLAREIGCPAAARAVGNALAKNPLPLIIPCHRVIGTDGTLTGFGGGITLKKRLLALEKGRG